MMKVVWGIPESVVEIETDMLPHKKCCLVSFLLKCDHGAHKHNVIILYYVTIISYMYDKHMLVFTHVAKTLPTPDKQNT